MRFSWILLRVLYYTQVSDNGNTNKENNNNDSDIVVEHVGVFWVSSIM